MAQKKKKRRKRYPKLDASLSKANTGIENVMEDMEVGKWDYRRVDGEKAIIAWLLDGKEYQVWCERFKTFRENLRACERCLTLIFRVYETYQVQAADVPADLGLFFMGFRVESGRELLALPAPTTTPWEILGVSRDSTLSEIGNAFREKLKVAHPDQGGSDAACRRLTEAKEEMVQMRGK